MADMSKSRAVRAYPNPSNLITSLNDNLNAYERKLEAESQDLYDMLVVGISDATKNGLRHWYRYNIDAQQLTLQHAVKRLRRDGLRVRVKGEFDRSGKFSFLVMIRM